MYREPRRNVRSRRTPPGAELQAADSLSRKHKEQAGTETFRSREKKNQKREKGILESVRERKGKG